MPIIHTDTTILVEFKDVIAYTDILVLKAVRDLVERKPDEFMMFKQVYTEFTDEPDSYVLERSKLKTDLNPLMDYVDKNLFGNSGEMDNFYHNILINYIGQDSLIASDMISYFSLITKEDNLKAIYVYYPFYSKAIHSYLKIAFGDNPKVKFITGSLSNIIRTTHITSYFLRSTISVIDLMASPKSSIIKDVFFMDIAHNYIDNDCYRKVLNISDHISNLRDNYGLNISVINN